MSEPRLAAGVEASAFLRRAERDGGFGTVLNKGDEQRGTLLLAISERGVHRTCLARQLRPDGRYGWVPIGPQALDETDSAGRRVAEFLEKRRRSDPDEWQIELDIPSAQRFIAETSAMG